MAASAAVASTGTPTRKLRGDAGQNAPPGGNSRYTTYKTPQKDVAAFVPLVLHSFAPF